MSQRAATVAILAGALGMGGLVAWAPALLGEPAGEHPALRALTLAAVLFLMATWLVATLGLRSARVPASGRSKGRAAQAFLRIAATLVLVGAPSFVAGIRIDQLVETIDLLQKLLGWATPVNGAVLGLACLAAVFSACLLFAATRRRPLRGIRALLASVTALLVLVLSAVFLVERYGAAAGTERVTKATLLGCLLSLGIAAAFARRRESSTPDRRAMSLAAGAALTGLLAAAVALDYVTPTPADLDEVIVAADRDGWTLLNGSLKDRPDLYGIFALAPGSQRLELVSVSSETPWGELPSMPQHLAHDVAYLAPLREPAAKRSPTEDIVKTGEAEIRLRSRWLPAWDRSTGLRIETPGTFAVAPGASFAVASRFDPDWVALTRQRRRPGSYIRSGSPPPRYQLELVRPWLRYPTPEVLARNLPYHPRVLWIDERAFRLLVVSGQRPPMGDAVFRGSRGSPRTPVRARAAREVLPVSQYRMGPQFLGAATYLVDEKRWIDRQVSNESVGNELQVAPDRRTVLAPCASMDFYGVRCAFDLEQLGAAAVILKPPGGARGFGAWTVTLAGTLAMLWHEGYQPDLHWRLSLFDSRGAETRTVDLEGCAVARFAGELEDGSIAVACRSRPPTRTDPDLVDWSIESIHPSTGARRELASGLSLFRIYHGSVMRVFTDPSGRLLVPTADGMVDATKGRRRFVPSLASTGRTTSAVGPGRGPSGAR